MKKTIYITLLILSWLQLKAQDNSPSGTVNRFLAALVKLDARLIQPFLYDGLNYQVFEIDKSMGVSVKIYTKPTYLYAIDHTKKNEFTETYEMGMSANETLLSTVWTTHQRTFKNGKIQCGNRVFTLVLLQNGWQIIQAIETIFEECPTVQQRTKNIRLPSPF